MNLVLIFLFLVFAASILIILAAVTRQTDSRPQEADSHLPPPPIIRPVARAPLTITPHPRGEDIVTIVPSLRTIPTITPAFHPVWEERGWKRSEANNGTVVYNGAFQVFDEQAARLRYFQGALCEVPEREIEVRVQDIPPELYASTGTHPKRFCFRPIDPTNPPVWYQLNWHKPTRDPSSAILYTERLLYEAINYKW